MRSPWNTCSEFTWDPTFEFRKWNNSSRHLGRNCFWRHHNLAPPRTDSPRLWRPGATAPFCTISHCTTAFLAPSLIRWEGNIRDNKTFLAENSMLVLKVVLCWLAQLWVFSPTVDLKVNVAARKTPSILDNLLTQNWRERRKSTKI